MLYEFDEGVSVHSDAVDAGPGKEHSQEAGVFICGELSLDKCPL